MIRSSDYTDLLIIHRRIQHVINFNSLLWIASSVKYTQGDHFQDEQPCAESLLVSARNLPSFLRINSENHASTSYSPNIELSNTIAMAVDQPRGLLFFIDDGLRQIFKQDFKRQSEATVIKTLANDATPEKIAIETQKQRIYYTDSSNNSIISLDYDGNDERQFLSNDLLWTNVHTLKALLLDSDARAIYFTDVGPSPKIGVISHPEGNIEHQIRVLMDSDIVHPNALTADFSAGRIYWCDGGLGTISSMNRDGTYRRLVASQSGSRFYDIILVHETLYVVISDPNRSEVLQTQTTVGSNLSSIINGATEIHALASVCFPDPTMTSPITSSTIITSSTTITASTTVMSSTSISSTTVTSSSETSQLQMWSITTTSTNLNAADSSTVLTSSTLSTLMGDQPGDEGSSDSTVAVTPALRTEGESSVNGNDSLIIIIGIVAGSLVAMVFIASVTCFMCRRGKRKSSKQNLPRNGNEFTLNEQTSTSQNEQNTQYESTQNRFETDLYNENAYTDLTKEPPKTDGEYDQVYQEINERDLQRNEYERHLPNTKAVEDRRDNSYIRAFPNQAINHVL